MKKTIMTTALFTFLIVSCRTGWCAGDPFKTHDKAFGINIDGIRLGMRFKDFDEIISFAFDKFVRTDSSSGDLTIDAMMIDGTDTAGRLRVWIERKDKTWAVRNNSVMFYDGPLFVNDPGSLKEQAQRKNWTVRDYFSFADKCPGWIVRLDGAYGTAFFVRENQQDPFYLVSFGIKDGKYRKDGTAFGMEPKDLALLLMDKYGVEDFTVDDGKIIYKNPSEGYAIHVSGGIRGSEATVVALADADTVYPLCPVADSVIYYIDDVLEPGKKQIYPRIMSAPAPYSMEKILDINALSDWAFNGLSSNINAILGNRVTFGD